MLGVNETVTLRQLTVQWKAYTIYRWFSHEVFSISKGFSGNVIDLDTAEVATMGIRYVSREADLTNVGLTYGFLSDNGIYQCIPTPNDIISISFQWGCWSHIPVEVGIPLFFRTRPYTCPYSLAMVTVGLCFGSTSPAQQPRASFDQIQAAECKGRTHLEPQNDVE